MSQGKLKIGYCRVSTHCGEQLSALQNQIDRVQACGVDQVITDIESGSSNSREGMSELLNLIDQDLVGEIISTRVDRLGRDATATDSLILLAAQRSITIRTIDGGLVEAETPQGFLMSRLHTTLAEMETRMLSLRITRGLQQRRKNRFPVRSRAPWGYQISQDKTCFQLDPVQSGPARDFLLLLEKLNWRMTSALIASKPEPKLTSVMSVKGWLYNPILRGGIGYHRFGHCQYREIVWDTHEALITHDKFKEISSIMDSNRTMWGFNAKTQPKLLTGLCKCPNCGNRLCYSKKNLICAKRGCVSQYKSTKESVIVEAINEKLQQAASKLGDFLEDEPPEAQALRDQIKRLESMDDPDLAEAVESKKRKLNALLQSPCPETLERVEALASSDAWKNATVEELRLVYQEFVKQAWADRGRVTGVDLKI